MASYGINRVCKEEDGTFRQNYNPTDIFTTFSRNNKTFHELYVVGADYLDERYINFFYSH